MREEGDNWGAGCSCLMKWQGELWSAVHSVSFSSTLVFLSSLTLFFVLCPLESNSLCSWGKIVLILFSTH